MPKPPRRPVPMRSTDLAALLIALLTAVPAAGQPLSASDWLSGGTTPGAPVSAWRPGDAIPRDVGRRAPRKPESLPPQVAADVRVPAVGVTPLPGPDADIAGTLSASTAGLPRDLWAGTDAATAAEAISAARPRLPATQALLRTLLTAQLDPPTDATGTPDPDGRLFLARVDRLLGLGAVDAATGLLDAAGPGGPERFRRRFDAALLLGTEDRACAVMATRPGVAPDIASRLYCLARAGNWDTAATALHAARATDLVDPVLAQRLAAFLDDAGTDAEAGLPLPDPVTPLSFRMMAAIGQPLATADLPPAFAWSDLGPDGGWKARLDAAERLARSGSLPAARLRDIYLEERPAASGGVWDRAAAMQALDAALASGNREAAAAALPPAVAGMGQAGLTAALADIHAEALLPLVLDGPAGRQALHLALYDAHRIDPQVYAAMPNPVDPGDAWLVFVARRVAPPVAGAPQDPLGAALVPVLTDAPPAPPDGSRGLALLAAMADADAGLDGDVVRAARGIATLRALGREDTARAAALQLLLGPQLGVARL